MLVLTRLKGEKICIGDEVVIEITHSGTDRVRLGVSAPPEKVILRGEFRESLDAETEKTAVTPMPNAIAPLARCG